VEELASGVTLHPIADRDQALGWLTTEHAAILAAVEHAVVRGFDEHAVRLAEAVGQFLNLRGHWHDWAASQRTALAAAVRLGDRPAQARIHRQLGIVHTQVGHPADARADLTRALDLYVELGDPIGQAATHRSFSSLLTPSTAAVGHAEQALALYRAAGDEDGGGNALNDVGYYSAQLGQHQRAVEYCRKIMERWIQTCRRELLDRTLITRVGWPCCRGPEPGDTD
jgi:tetratricopeptide (TPR) repeat protein